MSEKTTQSLQELPSARLAEKSRIFPFAVAVVVCSVIAFVLGYGGWYFFGTHNKIRIETLSRLKINLSKRSIPNRR